MPDSLQRFETAIVSYRPHLIADLVVLFGMSIPYRLAPHIFLELDAPDRFRAECHTATQKVDDAVFDQNSHTWRYDEMTLLRAFAAEGIPQIAPMDMARFCDWLEDGYCLNFDPFAPRIMWISALRWILTQPAAVKALSQPQYAAAREFAVAFQEAVTAESYADATDAIYSDAGDDLDALLQTKFNFVFLDDDLDDEEAPMAHSPLQWIDTIREGHILRRQLQDARGQAGLSDALERLVLAYVARDGAPDNVAALKDAFAPLRIAQLFDWDRDA
ncbi:hypothetical protein [Yoonia sp. 2307UL14-13]|uniref:hypothetical protein n=1 Tax=Yoonia sp. 2307UL14-13 TaxID=3126506 RepID=UPI0030A633BE